MSYTILSAAYSNPFFSAVIAETQEAGSVIISRDDDPVAWALLDEISIAPFVEPFALPDDISRRQFAQGLAELGLIAEADAEEWTANGTLPAAILALVDALPAEQRFPARMLVRGATKFEFSHPLAEAFAGLADPPWSLETRAAFWRHCATL
ncbi:hypothetical protein [Bosea minatitlanensis]|uniref:PIN domain-containing protein n=1 Tax=Bosea minatitlanensis TaxID=128782 RepID=A0ABW0EZU8_9HYPH|nr:hypothetical protein [Bosea minatitlanensis]MCT4495405.1 hypothetical protein [Bosea minatitlanensis]